MRREMILTHLDIVFLLLFSSVCNMFAQLGARGSSLLFSSGDGGVGGFMVGDNDCVSNDGAGVRFQPVFPASCKYSGSNLLTA